MAEEKAIAFCYVMLYNIAMARGKSGRIVLEIDPAQKETLYSVLVKDGLTLKEWFLGQAEEYLLAQLRKPSLTAVSASEEEEPYVLKPEPTARQHEKTHPRRGKAKSK